MKLPPENYFPTVTFVVPFYNERDLLARCVESLLNLDYPKEKLEVILVNDASTDGSDAIAERLSRNQPIVKVFRNETRRGPSAGLNLGIRLASGELIAHMAADILVEAKYLRKLTPHFKDPSVGAVIPRMNALGDETSSRLFRLDAPVSAPGFMVARRTVLQSVGPYDSLFYRKLPRILGGFKIYFREDTDLVLSIGERGYRVIGEPSAVAFHPIDRVRISDVPRLGLRHCLDPLLLKKHPRSAKAPLKVVFWRITYWALGWSVASASISILLYMALQGNVIRSLVSGTIVMILYSFAYLIFYRHGGSRRLISPIILYLYLTMVMVGRLYGSVRERYFVL